MAHCINVCAKTLLTLNEDFAQLKTFHNGNKHELKTKICVNSVNRLYMYICVYSICITFTNNEYI